MLKLKHSYIFLSFIVWNLGHIQGKYSYEEFDCYGDEPIVTNGAFISSEEGRRLEILCDPGYFLPASFSRVKICSEIERKFIPDDYAICEDIDECQNLENFQLFGSGFPHQNQDSHDGIADYEDVEPCGNNSHCVNTEGDYQCDCNQGFYKENGKCIEEKFCTLPPNPEHGHVEKKTDRDIKIVCDQPNYQPNGHSDLTCLPNGTWDKRIPTCFLKGRYCLKPKAPLNGDVSTIQFPKINTIARYECEDGYKMIGPRSRQCLGANRWTDFQPYCRKNLGLLDVASNLERNFIDKYNGLVDSIQVDKTINENGQVGLSLSTRNNNGLDLVFLIDRSSSILDHDLKSGIYFIKLLVEEFSRNVTNATFFWAVSIGNEAEVVLTPSTATSKETIKTKLDAIKPRGGGTALTAALQKVLKQLKKDFRPTSKRAVFILADGDSNMPNPLTAILADGDSNMPNPLTAEEIATEIKDEGIEIYAIGLGADVDENKLAALASPSAEDHVFMLKSYEDLKNLASLLIDRRQDKVKCGISGMEEIEQRQRRKREVGLVAGGNKVIKGKWPWMVLIHQQVGDKLETPCGGVLICKHWVLTSHDCVKEKVNDSKWKDKESLIVVLGENDANEDEDFEQNLPVIKIKANKDKTLALLKLESKANLNRYVRTICVPKKGDRIYNHGVRAEDEAWVAGWGVTELENKKEKPEKFDPSYLNDILIKVASGTECESQMDQMKRDKSKIARRKRKNYFCAGTKYSENDACYYDEGGPLMYKEEDVVDGRFYVIGVLVSPEGCTGKYKYGIYGKVLQNLDWIHNTTNSCNLNFH